MQANVSRFSGVVIALVFAIAVVAVERLPHVRAAELVELVDETAPFRQLGQLLHVAVVLVGVSFSIKKPRTSPSA